MVFKGVKAIGAGGGKLFTIVGELGEGEITGEERVLSISLSGDSTSPICKSDRILCAKGEQFEGEKKIDES